MRRRVTTTAVHTLACVRFGAVICKAIPATHHASPAVSALCVTVTYGVTFCALENFSVDEGAYVMCAVCRVKVYFLVDECVVCLRVSGAEQEQRCWEFTLVFPVQSRNFVRCVCVIVCVCQCVLDVIECCLFCFFVVGDFVNCQSWYCGVCSGVVYVESCSVNVRIVFVFVK